MQRSAHVSKDDNSDSQDSTASTATDEDGNYSFNVLEPWRKPLLGYWEVTNLSETPWSELEKCYLEFNAINLNIYRYTRDNQGHLWPTDFDGGLVKLEKEGVLVTYNGDNMANPEYFAYSIDNELVIQTSKKDGTPDGYLRLELSKTPQGFRLPATYDIVEPTLQPSDPNVANQFEESNIQPITNEQRWEYLQSQWRPSDELKALISQQDAFKEILKMGIDDVLVELTSLIDTDKRELYVVAHFAPDAPMFANFYVGRSLGGVKFIPTSLTEGSFCIGKSDQYIQYRKLGSKSMEIRYPGTDKWYKALRITEKVDFINF